MHKLTGKLSGLREYLTVYVSLLSWANVKTSYNRIALAAAPSADANCVL